MNERKIKNRWILEAVIDSKADMISILIASSISNFLQIFIALFAMVIYNKIVPNNAIDTLLTISIGIFIIIIADFFFKILKGRIQQDQSASLEVRLSDRLFKKIMSWDLQAVPKLPGSSAMLLRDVESVVQLFGNASVNVVVGLPFIFIYTAVIYSVAGKLAYVTILSAIMLLFLSFIYFKLIEGASTNAKDAQVAKSGAFIETLNNIEGVKSLGDYSYFQDKWHDIQKANTLFSGKLGTYLHDASTLASSIAALAQIAILAFGAFLIFSGEISSGALIAAVLMHGRAQQPLQGMVQFLMRYSVAKTAVKRIDQVFSVESNEDRRRQNIKVNNISAAVSFRSVEFNVGDVQRSVLTVPLLDFPVGQKVGILGSVGSGKSTFLKLLAGVLTPTQGSVSFGAYDTSAIDQSMLRSSVAYLGQQPAIFSGTIRENISLSKRGATDDEIAVALQLSGFDRILKGFPNGLSFVLSEGGRELSGGQKQILALARTLLSNPTVVALDEPTSAMDPRHELLFIKRIAEFTESRSFFVVTHRRPILALVDRIIVIENGNVVMDGPKDEILAKF